MGQVLNLDGHHILLKFDWIYGHFLKQIVFCWRDWKLGDNLINPIWNPMNRNNLCYFKYSGKNKCREWDIKYISWVEISTLSSFNILVGMLFGQTNVFEFKEDITFCCISYLLVGLRKKEFWFLAYIILLLSPS